MGGGEEFSANREDTGEEKRKKRSNDITATSFTWTAGGLNATSEIKGTLKLLTGSGWINASDAVTGSDLVLNGTTMKLNNIFGTLTFTNNAGISMSNGAVWDWVEGDMVTAGTGIIMNQGGDFLKDPNTGGKPTNLDSALPYVNNDKTAFLIVPNGSVAFSGKGAQNGVSVLQNFGSIQLGNARANGGGQSCWRCYAERRFWFDNE